MSSKTVIWTPAIGAALALQANAEQRREARELIAAAQNARRQQELREKPRQAARSVSAGYLAALEGSGALRRVS